MPTFYSPTDGPLAFYGVIETLIDYMDKAPQRRYRVVVGTDSQVHAEGVDFVRVVAIHRIGRGGRYFWHKERQARTFTLRNRIYEEAARSLALAQELVAALEPALKNNGGAEVKYDLEIHVDIGPNGPTRAMIQEIVGMITANGFNVKTKPEAYGAFVVADKHT